MAYYQLKNVPDKTDSLVEKAAKIKGLKKNPYLLLALAEHAKETIKKDKE